MLLILHPYESTLEQGHGVPYLETGDDAVLDKPEGLQRFLLAGLSRQPRTVKRGAVRYMPCRDPLRRKLLCHRIAPWRGSAKNIGRGGFVQGIDSRAALISPTRLRASSVSHVMQALPLPWHGVERTSRRHTSRRHIQREMSFLLCYGDKNLTHEINAT